MMAAVEQLRLQASEWGIELEHLRWPLLSAYADLLAGYDLANVIGTRDREKILREHVLDSLSCLTVEDIEWGGSLIDIGTGGGLPGIPLGIARPELCVTLLEATEKKVRFLEFVRAELTLNNLQVLHARAEEVGKDWAYRGTFDLATTRAVAALPVVLEYCAPLVRTGGKILAMKGRLTGEELSTGAVASRELGIELREVREVNYRAQLPQKERRLVVFDKVGVTPGRFPRKAGLAKKRPLGIR